MGKLLSILSQNTHTHTHSGQVRKSRLSVVTRTRRLMNGRNVSTMTPSSYLTRARCGNVVFLSARSWRGSTRPSSLTTTSWPPSWSVAMVAYLAWSVAMVPCTKYLASFPGSPRTQTENWVGPGNDARRYT